MTFNRTQLINLIEGLIEGRLEGEEIEKLESVLRNDRRAMEFYSEYLFNHAALSLHAHERTSDREKGGMLLGLASIKEFSEQPDSPKKWYTGERRTKKLLYNMTFRPRFTLQAGLLSGALLFALLLFAGLWRKEFSYATISSTTNCLWADSSTQTQAGSRLGRCVLALQEGVARIQFDCDAAISLEGPSVLEIQSEKRVVLRSGRLIASIESPLGKGFVVDTPLGKITDWGTQFGVHVPLQGPGSVHVLDGEVEVLLRGARQVVSITQDEMLELKDSRMRARSPDSATDKNQKQPRIIQVSSVQGRGAESWVIRDPETIKTSYELFPYHVARPYMLVKNSFETHSNRKAIFRIDLSALTIHEKREFETVSLAFSYGPTELGYASNVPVSQFTVYGLTDESMDVWDEKDHDWFILPDNSEEAELFRPIWVSLGSFFIKQGSRTGTITIQSEALAEFIRADGNNLVSFAIVRDTEAKVKKGLVHGFANRYHATLMPPRLVFQLKNDTAHSNEQ